MCFAARVPHFKCYSKRLRTFNNWSRTQTGIKPESLANVGFFRIKERFDAVQCFYCGIKIIDWEPLDDPLSEHLRWSSTCAFANMIQHLNAVNELLAKTQKLYEKLTTCQGVDVAGNTSTVVTGSTDCCCHH